MKTLNKDIRLLFKIVSNNKLRKEIGYVQSDNGYLISTDMDNMIIIGRKVENGLYSKEGLKLGIPETLVDSNYPKLENLNKFTANNYLFRINSKLLFDALKRLILTANKSSVNLALHGIRFKLKNNYLTLASSDTYRLSIYTIPEINYDDIQFTLNYKICKALVSDLKGLDCDMAFEVYENQVKISYFNRKIYSKLDNLSFPDFESILSNSRLRLMQQCDLKEFERLLKEGSFISKNNGENKTRMCFYFNEGALKLINYWGDNKIIGPIDFTGDNLNIALNCKYVLDAIKFSKLKYININSNNSSSMIKIDDGHYSVMIMPVVWPGESVLK